MDNDAQMIRCLILRTSASPLILPNASVSEIIGYTPPRQISGAPDWLLGQMTWRGWRLPLCSLSLLTGQGEGAPMTTAKVAIVKALGKHPRMPFLALRIQGFPHLSNVTETDLVAQPNADALPGIVAPVQVKDELALIPDIKGIEELIWRAVESERAARA